MHVMRGSFHRDRARAGRFIQYISHREEPLPGGQRREIHGIGERYLDVGRTVPDAPARERAYQRLILEDARQLRRPVFHQRVFTVDDRAAAKLGSLPRARAERELREVLGRALRVPALGRQIQGVYAIHWHGGDRRPAHPHIHALFSPLRRDGCPLYLSKANIGVLWGAWNREVDRSLLVLRSQPLRHPTPGRLTQARIDSWVMGTAVAQALRRGLLRPDHLVSLPALAAALGRPPGAECLSALMEGAEFAHHPLRTLVRLATMTALKPLPRPMVAVARALQGLSRDRGPEL